MKSISIIIPVYNEKDTLPLLLAKLDTLIFTHDIQKQIIVIDDGSTDGTRELIAALDAKRYITILQPKNAGKGAAIRAGLKKSTGEYVVIQDADLEYDPEDLVRMLDVMIAKNLPVIYGSRRRKVNFRHAGAAFYFGGLVLTIITNILFLQKITDEPTCYKMFKGDLIRSWPLVCNRFEFCPEVTAYAAKEGIKIQEIPIAYYPRTAVEGKKIKAKDFFEAVWTLVKMRINV